jgi:hypothetical protein
MLYRNISRSRDLARYNAPVANVGVYLPSSLQDRIQALKEKGVDLPVSVICQRALEAAIEAEERALAGDRLARVLARLKSTRTPGEQMAAEGEAAGRRWAEEVAALSELRRVREVRESMEANRLAPQEVQLGSHRGSISFVTFTDDDVDHWGSLWVPGNLPREFFDRAATSHDHVVYLASGLDGFLRGAVAVLDAVEEALEMEPPAEDWHRNDNASAGSDTAAPDDLDDWLISDEPLSGQS